MPVSPLPPRAGISANRLRAPGGRQTHARSGDPVPATVGEWLRAEFPDATDADLAALLRQSDEPVGGPPNTRPSGRSDRPGDSRSEARSGEPEALAGQMCDAAGRPVTAADPVVPGGFYWFHRPVPPEARIPFEVGIVHADADLLVVDKPHFLASTPNGRFVRECVVTRLRVEREEPDLVAIHRLDRVTAGLLVLSRRPETRGAYQRLFQDRRVRKTYRALAEVPAGFDASTAPSASRGRGASAPTGREEVPPPDGTGGWEAPRSGDECVRRIERWSRLEKEPGTRQMLEVPGEPNAHTTIEYLGAAGCLGDFRLTPHTGRTHQLRVHMNGLGLPILGDPVYPVDLAPDPYDFSSPLQLLAEKLAFTDPLTGEPREFTSRLTLSSALG